MPCQPIKKVAKRQKTEKLLSNMELSSYIPLLVQIIVAVGLGIAIVAASHIFGQRSPKNKIKDSAYECGIVPEGAPHPRFGARFYLVAMLFVIFDIEIVFMLPLAMAYSDLLADGVAIVIPAFAFIAAAAAGIIYEIKKDVLNWNIPKSN